MYYNPCLQYRNKIKAIFFLGNITEFENFVRGLCDILKVLNIVINMMQIPYPLTHNYDLLSEPK